MVTTIRYFGTIAVLAAALFSAQAAQATGESCMNDINCKTGPSCGGEVCDWTKGMTCQPATASGSGQEGWCTVDTDCKCAGAKCNLSQCSQTVPAAGTGGGSGAGGSGSSAAGSSAAGGSAAGSSAAGSSATGDSSSSSSGCSFAGVAPRGSLNLALGAACAVGLAFARRRKRAS